MIHFFAAEDSNHHSNSNHFFQMEPKYDWKLRHLDSKATQGQLFVPNKESIKSQFAFDRKKVSDGKKLAALEIYAKYVSVRYLKKMK